jgi:EAL domain-containing protein (putative c-di-GMP-specific phosphodiesterase class I)
MAFAKLNVMVVEDHGFQRRMALRLLAELGVSNVHEAADGDQALALLKALPEIPDIVIIDLDLPGMDGIELIGHLAQAKLARAVVVASALDPALLNTVQTMARAYGLRVLTSVEKPLTTAKLTELMTAYEAQDHEFDDDIHVEISREAISDGMAAGDFVAFFQPQVTLTNGHVVAVEALARWNHADGQMVKPAHFIPVMEREGLIDQLTDQMLEASCAWKSRWARSGLHLRIAVNVSMHNLHSAGVVDRYLQLVKKHDIDPREVVLEITESAVMGEAAQALNVLARLRLKGFGLSIDDFGTGYSSLSQLSQIPFTELKIDQSFVSGAHRQPRKRAVIEASLGLAGKLNLGVVAEGVENVEEWQMLADLGCTYAQGYLISRPISGDQLPDVVAHWRRPQA